MPRTLRDAKLDTRSARTRLAERREPYWRSISDGLGLGYRRGSKGGTWIARHYTPEAGRRFNAIGTADDVADADGVHVLSFNQAQEAARAWFSALARQDGNQVEPSGPYSVADAVADYRADYLRRGGKAVDRLDWSASAWITADLGKLSLDRLTKVRILAWHQKIAESPPRLRSKAGEPTKYRTTDNGPEAIRRRRSTANRVLTILKGALNHAHREGKCASDDAWRTVRAYREADAARLRYLSDDEARRLTNGCAPDFRILVTAALLTGCRYGELVAMTAEDFNPDAGTLQVRTSKSGKPRHVVLTTEGQGFVAGLAAGRARTAGLFLRADGKPWGASHQHRPLVAACAAARIDPPINFHGLRHTYASRLAMRGVPLAVVAAQLGHSDTRMVEKHYGHLAPSYVADTVRAAFGSLGIVEPANVVSLSG